MTSLGGANRPRTRAHRLRAGAPPRGSDRANLLDWPVEVVSLERTPERWAAFERQNHGLAPYRRFSAVDGSAASREALAREGVIAPDLPYSNGAIGNALSQITLWRRAVAERRPVTICEDDAVLHQGFASLAPELAARAPEGWDVLKWGWNFDSVLEFELLPGIACWSKANDVDLPRNIEAFQHADVSPMLRRIYRAFGTFCYTVSPQGAYRLLESLLPLRPATVFVAGLAKTIPNRSIDVVINGVLPTLNAYVSLPPIAASPNDKSRSTIWSKGGG